jgi:hypothetical protein
MSHVKCPLFLLDFNKTLIQQIFEKKKKLKYQVSSKPIQWVVPYRRIDMKLIVAFRSFAKAPKN